MPLPGTPWRDAAPAFIPVATLTELDRLAQQGASYEAAAESDLLANAVSAAFPS